MLSKLKSTVRRLFPQGSTADRIMLLAGGTATAQLIAICALPIVTRLYTPEQVGSVSLFLSFSAFWIIALSWRYEVALLVAKSDDESHVICRLAIGLVFLMSLIGVFLLWLLIKFNLLGFKFLPIWAPIIAAPIFIGQGVYMIYRSWVMRAGLINEITNTTIYRSGASALAKIGFGALGWGGAGLFAAELVAACVSVLKLYSVTTIHYFSSKPKNIDSKTLFLTGKQYCKFPLLETPSAWLDASAMLLPIPLIATLYGAEAAGWFGLARTVVTIPISQIGGAVADIFQIELVKAVLNHDMPRIRKIFYATIKKMALLGILPLIASVIILPWLMPIIFGSAWGQAGIAAAAIAPWFYAALIISPISRIFSVLQVQEFKLFYDIASITFLLLIFYFANAFGLTFIEFCIAISLTKLVEYIFYCALLIGLVEYKTKNNRRKDS